MSIVFAETDGVFTVLHIHLLPAKQIALVSNIYFVPMSLVFFHSHLFPWKRFKEQGKAEETLANVLVL